MKESLKVDLDFTRNELESTKCKLGYIILHVKLID